MALAAAAPLPIVGTDAWREWRDSGLGASDLPAVLGEDPWRTERELALEKRRLIPPRKVDSVMDLGHDIEDLIARRYARQTGRRLARYTRPVISRRWRHVFADPDRRVLGEKPLRLVEVKWRGAGWDAPPRRVEIQAMGQMGLTGAAVVDVATMDAWGNLAIHEIERNDVAVHNLLELADSWYERYVLGPELPPIDASKGTRRHLDTLPGGDLLDAQADKAPELDALMAALREVRHDQAGLEQERARVENLICAALAGHDGADGDGWRIAYRRTKERVTTDWKLVAAAFRRVLLLGMGDRKYTVVENGKDVLASEGDALLELGLPVDMSIEDAVAAIESLHTVTEPGSRPFRPSWQD